MTTNVPNNIKMVIITVILVYLTPRETTRYHISPKNTAKKQAAKAKLTFEVSSIALLRICQIHNSPTALAAKAILISMASPLTIRLVKSLVSPLVAKLNVATSIGEKAQTTSNIIQYVSLVRRVKGFFC